MILEIICWIKIWIKRKKIYLIIKFSLFRLCNFLDLSYIIHQLISKYSYLYIFIYLYTSARRHFTLEFDLPRKVPFTHIHQARKQIPRLSRIYWNNLGKYDKFGYEICRRACGAFYLPPYYSSLILSIHSISISLVAFVIFQLPFPSPLYIHTFILLRHYTVCYTTVVPVTNTKVGNGNFISLTFTPLCVFLPLQFWCTSTVIFTQNRFNSNLDTLADVRRL